jgi:CBS domain containing-hemolysin-like protein
MTWQLSVLVGLLVVLAITAATGYFVAQEFGYMSVDRSRLKARAAGGDAAAARALAVTRRTSFMLSGAQLGITVTGLVVGYVAEPLIGSAIGQAMGVVVPAAVGVAIGTVLALLLSTGIQMIFGELFPKNLAIARAEAVAVGLARSTLIYLTVFGWLIQIFDRASNLLLRALRIEPVHDVEHSATARDLEHIVAESRQSGDLPAELSELLDRILDFPSRDVEHAMVHRTAVDVLQDGATVADAREAMSSGHSRYPVLDTEGEVVGTLHLEDLLRTDHPSSASVRSLMREPLVVPTVMPLPDALRLLSASKNQLACVVDEFGGFAGVVTLEDLAEELVGEIADEHDAEGAELVAQTPERGVWVLSGRMHLDEVERIVSRELPRGDFETIAGLVIAEHRDLPDPGISVDIDLPADPTHLALSGSADETVLRVEVLTVERHVPTTVRVTLVQRSRQDGEQQPGADGDRSRKATR